MKNILKISDVVDNRGRTDVYMGKVQIKLYLDDPGYWSDDAIIEYEEDGEKGICFIDDIVGQEVLIEDEVYLVEED